MVSTITVQLKHNQTLIIDAIDSDLLQAHRWHSAKSGRNWYAHTNTILSNGKRSIEKLHRLILARILNRPLNSSDYVDHVNGNGMDDRRENIRLSTKQQNRWNSRRTLNKTSSLYKGVYWNSNRNKYQASIRVNGRNKSQGYFASEYEAYQAYCSAAKKYFGEFASIEEL